MEVKENNIIKFHYNGKEYETKYNNRLISAIDRAGFMLYVCNTIIANDNYYSMLRELAFEAALIKQTTDIDIKELMNLDEDEELSFSDIEAFIANSNIIDVLMGLLSENTIRQLNRYIDKNIAFRTGLHENDMGAAIGRLFNSIADKIDGVDGKQLAGAIKTLSSIGNGDIQLESSIDGDTVSE